MGALIPGVEFGIEVSLGLSGVDDVTLYDDPLTALYDAETAVYAGNEIVWYKISPRFLMAHATRGRQTFTDRFPAGSMTVTLADEDGLFNPDMSLISIGGRQSLRVGRWVRLIAREDPNSEWVPVWTGRIDAMVERFSSGGSNIVMELQCSDLTSYFGRINYPALPTEVGAGESTGARYQRVLEAANYPVSTILPGDIDTGVNTMQATTLADSMQELLNQCADADFGASFMNRDGRPQFRQQDWLENQPQAFRAGFLGDAIQVVELDSLAWDSASVRNDVQISRVNGIAQRFVSSASQSRYGSRTYRRLDLFMETDQQAFEVAEKIVNFYEWDVARFSELELVPLTSDAALKLMTLELGSKILLQVRTLRGWSFTVEVYVQRVSHSVNAADWACKVVVENADRSDPGTSGPYSLDYSEAFKTVQEETSA